MLANRFPDKSVNKVSIFTKPKSVEEITFILTDLSHFHTKEEDLKEELSCQFTNTLSSSVTQKEGRQKSLGSRGEVLIYIFFMFFINLFGFGSQIYSNLRHKEDRRQLTI